MPVLTPALEFPKLPALTLVFLGLLAAKRLLFRQWGQIPYTKASRQQIQLAHHIGSGAGPPGVLVTCEHPPVITLGRGMSSREIQDSLLKSSDDLPVVTSTRGGKATYHGPGQLIFYPILSLGQTQVDVHEYIRFLESTIIRMLKGLGIYSETWEGKTGIWASHRKIAQIGLATKRKTLYHGVSLNVDSRVHAGFDHIVPCGLLEPVTTIEEEGGGVPSLNDLELGFVRSWNAECLSQGLPLIDI